MKQHLSKIKEHFYGDLGILDESSKQADFQFFVEWHGELRSPSCWIGKTNMTSSLPCNDISDRKKLFDGDPPGDSPKLSHTRH